MSCNVKAHESHMTLGTSLEWRLLPDSNNNKIIKNYALWFLETLANHLLGSAC